MHKKSFTEKAEEEMTMYNIVWNAEQDKYLSEVSGFEKYERYQLLNSEYPEVNRRAIKMYIGLINKGFIVEENLTDES